MSDGRTLKHKLEKSKTYFVHHQVLLLVQMGLNRLLFMLWCITKVHCKDIIGSRDGGSRRLRRFEWNVIPTGDLDSQKAYIGGGGVEMNSNSSSSSLGVLFSSMGLS